MLRYAVDLLDGDTGDTSSPLLEQEHCPPTAAVAIAASAAAAAVGLSEHSA